MLNSFSRSGCLPVSNSIWSKPVRNSTEVARFHHDPIHAHDLNQVFVADLAARAAKIRFQADHHAAALHAGFSHVLHTERGYRRRRRDRGTPSSDRLKSYPAGIGFPQQSNDV